MLVGTALPPTGAAQQSDEEGISLIALSVTSDVAQTHMYPAFHPDETRYDVAAPSEGDRVTVNAVAPPGEDVIWTGDDADPNLPGFQLVLTAGASTWISVAVNTFDLDAPLKFYGVSVSRASSEPKGWRVYHDIRVETMVDGASLPSHYLHGVWADSTRVLTSGGRIHSELTGDERFDEKLFAFNASDGSRRLADEFVLGGRPSEGIWSDGTTLWAMDWYGHLRAYDLSDGSLIANKGFNVRPSSFGHDGNGNSVKYTDNPSPRGIWSDGETVWILDRDRGKVLAYVLDGGSCSSWDFCRQEDKDFDLAGDNGTPWGITAGKSTANGDVDTWWVSDVDDDKLYAYNRSDGSRNASLDFDTLKSAGVTMPLGLHATDAIMYVVDFIENRVFAFSMPYVSGPIGPALVSSDATLSSLSLSNATLSPAPFDSAHTLYTAQVDNDVTSTTITAIPNHSLATAVVLDGSTAAEGGVVHLDQVGPNSVNTFTVRVTAPDGSINDYTVGVERRALSTDATLVGLTLSGVLEGNWGFVSDVFDYDVGVDNGVTSTTVTASLNDSGASYVVQLGGVTDNDRMIDLAEGENEITVVVTAEDDVATKTYTVTVTRATPSNDAFLFSLSLSGVDDDDLDFATDTYSYRVDVANGLTSTKVTATANDAAANIKITLGTTVAESNAMVDLTVDLAVGENEIIVEVTSRDSTKQEYTVTVDRDEPPPSSDASLSALSFSWVSAEDLGFVSDDFDYDVTVAHGLTVTTVEATTTDAGASYVVYLGGIEDTDRSINLAEGANAITVVVTAADGLTMMTYTVTVTRESEPALDDATLWKLELSDVTLNPVFVPATEMYTPPPVANGVTSTTVTAIPNHADATYVVQLDGVDDLDGTVGLDVGENVITVVVTAADNAAIKTYKVTVTRAASTPPPGNSGNTGNTGGGNNGGGIIGGGGNNNGGGDGGANDESSTTEEESDTESPYTDVGDGGTKQEDAINALYGLGVLTGTECEENRICPNDALTRWLAAVWLVRILDGKEPPAITESRFADVNASSMWEESMWFAPHVERLAELGITVGCSVTAPARYCPDDSLTRDQVASWLVRAFDLDSAASQGFTDTVDSTHETDIDSVVAAGIMSGCSTNPDRFCSQTVVTRGELALYVDRARKLSSDS